MQRKKAERDRERASALAKTGAVSEVTLDGAETMEKGLEAEIKAATKTTVIPIYHADSLFAVTPVSASLPLVGESETIPLEASPTNPP